jgi:hypothetical protein
VDTTTNVASNPAGTAYTGPATGVQEQYLFTGPDSANITASTNSWFIYSGIGESAIAMFGGTNVLDGGGGSNFLTGGSGTDTFFVNDQSPASSIWSTLNNFHAGDAATVFGITPTNANISWVDNQGAAGYTGLTLHVTTANEPTASLTLVGYSAPDLTDGRLTVEFGTEAGGTPYLYVLGASNTPTNAESSSASLASAPSSLLDLTLSGQTASAGSSGQINVYGTNDTVIGGGNSTIDLLGGGTTILDSGQAFNDTVVGFAGGGDHLSFAGETATSEAQVLAATQVVDGNTILSLPDHSSVTLVGVTHVDTSIFA